MHRTEYDDSMRYYIFQNGRILIDDVSGVPVFLPDAVRGSVLNSGAVDRDRPDGDVWVELGADCPVPDGYSLCERRTLWRRLGEEEFFRANKAFHYEDWQRTHRFCGLCGAENEFYPKEWGLKCTRCGEITFPVICPAIIVAVEKDGKILLGHGVNFPPCRYSVLAGFVEPGENLEECVVREVREETGISVKNIRYFRSQPWPFPRSLMLGFTAEWESGEIVPQKSELTDAAWFAPDEIPERYNGVSISAQLIEDFINRMKAK